MLRTSRGLVVTCVVAALLAPAAAAVAAAQAPVSYRVSFPSPEHHWMQVDATLRRRAGRTAGRCG